MDGPGVLSPHGPRHSNDHAHIQDLSVAPTTDEITSVHKPYLPLYTPDAEHHLQDDKVARMLDIQFRMVREDSLRGFDSGIKAVLRDLDSDKFDESQLAQRLGAGGGFYVTPGEHSVAVPLLANIEFEGVALDHIAGLVVSASADSPPSAARATSMKKRQSFWESSPRLPMGGLVAIVTKRLGGDPTFALATLTMMPNQFRHSKPAHDDRPRLGFGLHFLDNHEGLRMFQDVKAGDLRILVESPVLYPAVWPFLETLKAIHPQELPLSRYFVPNADLSSIEIDIPA
ncbi:hypothetical protein Q8F55_003318 [Vanrija albida]|uniref:Uncharacterized protein n=1 Tax=Vanrija albida TaxID=181172 RepID=A0ABR3Q4F5_9TREE